MHNSLVTSGRKRNYHIASEQAEAGFELEYDEELASTYLEEKLRSL